MPYFCVNTNADENGNNEVHETGKCSHLPDVQNRHSLGEHPNCKSALAEAKKYYAKADGCYWCCNDCHKG